MEGNPRAEGNQSNARRKVLYSSVCAMSLEAGFVSAEKAALETLVEMLQSLVTEIGRSSRAFCELSGRTETLVGDVVIALVEMGLNVHSIPGYGREKKRRLNSIPCPSQAPRQPPPKILQAGEKKPLSSYIPDHLPPFPDPHAYIRTPTHKQPVTEYEAIREKAASQKRDVERALTRFMAKTSESSLAHSLFPDEQMCHLFPLIALKVQPNAYLNALLPKDQVFEEDEEEESSGTPPKEPSKKSPKPVEPNDGEPGEENAGDFSNKSQAQAVVPPDSAVNVTDSDVPDNPYLRPAKVCKKQKKKHSNSGANNDF